MDPKHMPVDQRFIGFCIYCGEAPDTQEHVPSKIFLDEPFPTNLPTVESCLRCNNSFSADEEYLGCFIECVICGTTIPDEMDRKKIKKILNRKPELGKRIQDSMTQDIFGAKFWKPEEDRVKNIITKLARGHINFELSLPKSEEPTHVGIYPIALLSVSDRDAFEEIGTRNSVVGLPEMGSRAFHRVLGAIPFHNEPGPWIVIQEGRYRYAVEHDASVVRIVISDYLACEVAWNDMSI